MADVSQLDRAAIVSFELSTIASTKLVARCNIIVPVFFCTKKGTLVSNKLSSESLETLEITRVFPARLGFSNFQGRMIETGGLFYRWEGGIFSRKRNYQGQRSIFAFTFNFKVTNPSSAAAVRDNPVLKANILTPRLIIGKPRLVNFR